MSYFVENIIYVIVPTASVTEDMINNTKLDFNVTGNLSTNSLRKTTSGDKTIFKLKKPISLIFYRYEWFNHKDILIEVDKEEWVSNI